MTSIIKLEGKTLPELETIIHNGLEQFYLVGTALRIIRDKKKYLEQGFETFEEYCQDKWKISQSMGYHLMSASNVVDSLDNTVLPTKSSHASKLHIIKSDEFRNKAWLEVLDSGQDITGQLVERFARKYLLVEKDEELAKFVLSGLITSEHGILLYKTLHYLPPYYREIVLKYPTIDPLGLKSLRRLEVEFKDEFISIIQTGFLDNGRDTIPLGKLTERDVDSFFRRLKWEEGQTRKELVGEIQKAEIEKQGLHILDGINIAEGLTENAKKRAMVYLFPEGAYTAEQLAKMLEQNKFGVLFIAAYTENEPDLRFHDNVYVKPSQVNGVKPNYFLNAFKQSISI